MGSPRKHNQKQPKQYFQPPPPSTPGAKWEAKIQELVDALDASIPVPKRPLDAPFMMPIEAVFNISGRGTVVTGKVSKVWPLSYDGPWPCLHHTRFPSRWSPACSGGTGYTAGGGAGVLFHPLLEVALRHASKVWRCCPRHAMPCYLPMPFAPPPPIG